MILCGHRGKCTGTVKGQLAAGSDSCQQNQTFGSWAAEKLLEVNRKFIKVPQINSSEGEGKGRKKKELE